VFGEEGRIKFPKSAKMTESCHKGIPMQELNDTTACNSLKTITDLQLKHELKEAMEQIERGEYMGIDESFDSVIAKYAD